MGIAVALAMDAFAVSIAVGISLKDVNYRQFFRLSWHFGLFQALMPILGWGAGYTIRDQIQAWDHWIAFGLLAFVGTNMLRGALQPDEEKEPHPKDPTKGMSLVMLSVATSIDALAVGLSLSVLKISIFFPAVVIGITALLFTLTGLYLGKQVAALSKVSWIAEIIGGVVLWIIGINILIEHNVFS